MNLFYSVFPVRFDSMVLSPTRTYWNFETEEDKLNSSLNLMIYTCHVAMLYVKMYTVKMSY